MCDSLDEGGRRCPCDAPEARAARRRAKNATGEAPEGGIGLGGAGSAGVDGTAVASPSIREQWDPDRVRRIADLIHKANPSRLAKMSEGTMLSREEYDRLLRDRDDEDTQARHEAVFEAVEETGANTHEGMIRAVGDAVAAEAERRAGVSAADIEAASKAAYAAKMAEAEKVLEPLRHIIDSPENAERLEAAAAYEKSGLTQAQKTKAGERYITANQAMQDKFLPDSESINAFNAAIREEHRLRTDAVNGVSDDVRQGLSALSRAYSEVLSEVRPLGGQALWSEDSNKKAAKGFDEAVQVYPADWVGASNADGEMVAKVTKVRAHYHHNAVQEKKRRVPESRLKVVDAIDDESLPWDNPRKSVELLGPGDEEWETSRNGGWMLPGQYLFRVTNYEVDRDSLYDTRPGLGQKPPGRGWEEYYNAETGVHCWRRPTYRMRTEEVKRIREIKTSESDVQRAPAERGGPLFRTATHELAHRFEWTVPEIRTLEAEFKVRRTTDPETGEQEALVPLPGKGEVAYADKFVTAYVGKHYEHGSHEVMSMGAESLFAGSHGGLVGGGRYAADLDHRAFVLGVMAAVRPR